MANPITSTSIAAVAQVLPGSTLSGYAALSLLEWTKPYRVWRAASLANTEAVVIDFGVTRTLQAVFLDHLNTNRVKVQGHATNTWGSPSYDSTAVTIALDRVDARYKLFLDLSATSFASTGYRYLRVLNDNTTSLDGTTTWQVGTIAPLTSVTTWAASCAFPYEMAPRCEVIGDGSNVVRVGNRHAEIRVTHRLQDGDETSTADVLALGEAEPFIFYRNLLSTAEVYPVRRVGAASWSRVGPREINVPTYTLRGCD